MFPIAKEIILRLGTKGHSVVIYVKFSTFSPVFFILITFSKIVSFKKYMEVSVLHAIMKVPDCELNALTPVNLQAFVFQRKHAFK